MTTTSTCPSCNRDVSSDATFCMHCGAKVQSNHKGVAESDPAPTSSTPTGLTRVLIWPQGNIDIKPTFFSGFYKVKREYKLHIALSGEKGGYVSSSGILIAAICPAGFGWAPNNRWAEERRMGQLRKFAGKPAGKVHMPMFIDSIFGHGSRTAHAVILDVRSDDFSWHTHRWNYTGASERVLVWEYLHREPIELRQNDFGSENYQAHVWFITSDDRILYNHTSVDEWKG